MLKYYVYELVDPRDDSVFYVGKGCGKRVDSHEKEARAGIASKKCDRIRAIRQSGQAVGKRIVARFDDERLAYAHESMLIERHGSVLTNRGSVTTPDLARAARFRLLSIVVRIKGGRLLCPDKETKPLSSAIWRAIERRADELIKHFGPEFVPAENKA